MKGLMMVCVLLLVLVVLTKTWAEGVAKSEEEEGLVQRLTDDLEALLEDFLVARRLEYDLPRLQESSLAPADDTNWTRHETASMRISRRVSEGAPEYGTAETATNSTQKHHTAPRPLKQHKTAFLQPNKLTLTATNTASVSKTAIKTEEHHETASRRPEQHQGTTSPHSITSTRLKLNVGQETLRNGTEQQRTELETAERGVKTVERDVETAGIDVRKSRAKRQIVPNVIYRRKTPAKPCRREMGGSVFSSSSGAMAYISFVVNAIAMVVNINNNINNNNNNNNLNSNNNVNSNNANLNVNSNNANQVNIMPPGGKRRRREAITSPPPPEDTTCSPFVGTVVEKLLMEGWKIAGA